MNIEVYWGTELVGSLPLSLISEYTVQDVKETVLVFLRKKMPAIRTKEYTL